MSDGLKVARFYSILLAVFTAGRWAQSLGGTPYEKGHHVFSIVTLTLLASFFFAAFCRAWRGYGLLQAVMLGMLLGLMAQIVIFASTALSYALGLDTFFTNPRALQATSAVPVNEAMVVRVRGLIGGPVSNGFAAFLGWLLGLALPPAPTNVVR